MLSDNIAYSLIAYISIILISSFFYIRKEITVKEFYTGHGIAKPFKNGISVVFAEFGVWMVLYIPGQIYYYGVGQGWLLVGLFIGTMLAWYYLPYRFMRYTNKDEDVFTINGFFKRRFLARSKVMLFSISVITIVCSVAIMVLVISSFANTLETMLKIPFKVTINMVILGTLLCMVISGIKSTINNGRMQGLIFCGFLIAVVAIIIYIMQPGQILTNIMNSRVAGGASVYLNVIYDNGKFIEIGELISQLSFAILCFGLPNSIMSFYSFKNGNEIGKARRTVIIYSFVLFLSVAVFGAFSRAYLYPEIIQQRDKAGHTVFFRIIVKMFEDDTFKSIVAIGFLCILFAAAMAFTAKYLMLIASSLYGDIIVYTRFKRRFIKNEIYFNKFLLLFVALFIYTMTYLYRENGYDLSMVLTLLIVLGSAFSAVMISALYYKRMNIYGAVAGIISGFVTALLWEICRLYPIAYVHEYIHEYININGIIPAFLISSLMIIFVSRITKDVSEEVKEEFEAVEFRNV